MALVQKPTHKHGPLLQDAEKESLSDCRSHQSCLSDKVRISFQGLMGVVLRASKIVRISKP